MHHSDFTSFAMIASKFDVPIKTNYLNTGWDRETGRRGFEDTCGIVLGFLDEKLKADTAGVGWFHEAVHLSKGSTFSHFAAVCAPPSPREAVDLADQRGIDALKSIFMNSSGELPVGSCVDSALFNTYGYELLGKHRSKDALFIFEIVAWAHPSSANAQDSLADGLFAVGEKKRARAAIERAIELVPTDPTINGEAKSTFIGDEQRRLDGLK